jgi:hypothetical protein
VFLTSYPLIAHLVVHAIGLVSFAAGIAYAGGALSKLRDAPAYNARLLPFANFSFVSWIFWNLQYAILIARPFIPTETDVFVSIGLSFGVVSNAFWAVAVLSLSLQKLNPMWVVSPLLIAAAVSFRIPIMTSPLFLQIDAVSSAVVFTAFAYSIRQLRQSNIFAGAFFIHALSQWLWRSLWFLPLDKSYFSLLLVFPIWHIALLFGWTILISSIVERTEPSYREVIEEIEQAELLNPLNTLEVMISSTVEDLQHEREAAERAISSLRLAGLRAETIVSLSHAPIKVCELLAKRCDIFVLILGERYGYVIQPENISVVEFEFRNARAQNAGKILVYVKDGVVRDERLEKFCEQVTDIKAGYFKDVVYYT